MIPTFREVLSCMYCSYRDSYVFWNKGSPICAECWKRLHGKTITDIHHLYGRSRTDTIPIPANLHAYLTESQKGWPDMLKKFPNDPLLQIAYLLRAIKNLIDWTLTHLEQVDSQGNYAEFFKPYGDILEIKGAFSIVRYQVNEMFLQISLNLENASDWLVALQTILVEQFGKDYQTKIDIARFQIKSSEKEE